MEIVFLLVPLLVIFVLWLGSKILQKAGIEEQWVFCLLIPVVNIVMIWVFAFSKWPGVLENTHENIDDR